MRLTLRTMLAYLDDVLEPADAQDIGKKIEESEFAANIVHRTRDVMRRLRLGAPKLSGRGMGLDPNTVAEYLDSTLPAERVPDFEKVCLESDVHLAEVASCHQVLTIVLGERAEIDPESRERMYRLPEQLEAQAAAREQQKAAAAAAPAAASENGSTAAPPAVEPPKPERKRPEVPDYLREPASSSVWWRIAATLAAVVLFLCVVVMAIGPDEVARQLGWNRQPTTVAGGSSTQPESAAKANGEEKPGGGAQSLPATPPVQKNGDAEAPADAGEKPSLKQPDEVAVTKPVEKQGDEPAEPPVPGTARPGDDKPASAATQKPPAVAADADAAKTAAAADTRPADAAKTEAAKVEAAKTADGAKPPTPPANGAKPGESESVGRFLSNNQVLLRFNPADNVWQRVPQQQTLAAGDRIVSLPSFRSTISLSSGVNVELLGGSIAQLLPMTDGTSGIRLEHGRLVALTAGQPDVRVRLQAGDQQGVVTFDDAASTVALEVRPLRAEGTDPEAQKPQLQVDLYATDGKVTWLDMPGGEPQVITAPAQRRLAPPGSEAPAGNQSPEWVMADPISLADKIGGEFMAEYLTPGRPAALMLEELADHRRIEVRSLAVRSLTYLGEFDAIVAALNQMDAKQRIPWSDLVEDLRASIARGPETAVAVRRELEKQRGDAGAKIYRMLWGYTEQDLKGETGKMLIDSLDSEDLDMRSVAFWNLRNLTGLSLLYRPDMTAEQRKQHVAKWRTRFAQGQIGAKPDGTP